MNATSYMPILLEYAKRFPRGNTLVFVDSPMHKRAQSVNACFGVVDTVVAHDTQRFWADDIDPTSEYRTINFTDYPCDRTIIEPDSEMDDRPWTTLYTRDCKVFDHFSQDNIENEMYTSYTYPYQGEEDERETND